MPNSTSLFNRSVCHNSNSILCANLLDISAAVVWKYPLWKQSLSCTSDLGLETAIDADRKEASPSEELALYLSESCAVNSCSLRERMSIERRNW